MPLFVVYWVTIQMSTLTLFAWVIVHEKKDWLDSWICNNHEPWIAQDFPIFVIDYYGRLIRFVDMNHLKTEAFNNSTLSVPIPCLHKPQQFPLLHVIDFALFSNQQAVDPIAILQGRIINLGVSCSQPPSEGCLLFKLEGNITCKLMFGRVFMDIVKEPFS